MAQLQPLNSFATVGASSSQVLSANGSRSALILCNDSNVNIYISFGQAAVVGSGILLSPGATHDFSQFANLSPTFLGTVFAIASSGASNNLTICEMYN